MARAGSLAPPAGMSDNTVVTEYAVCDLRPSIPVITDGPDWEISPTEFFEYQEYIPSIYQDLYNTSIYLVYTWYHSKSIYRAYTRNMTIQKEYI